MAEAIIADQEVEGAHARMGRVARHSAFFFGGTLFVLVLSYGFRIYLARALGPGPLGIMALGESILAILVIVALMGLDSAAFRFVPVLHARREWTALGHFMWSALWQVVVVSLVLAVGLALGRQWVAGRIFNVPELADVLPLFGLILALRTAGSLLRAYVRGFQEIVWFTTITSYILAPLKILVTVVLVSMGLGVLALVLGEIAAAAFTLVFLALLWWRLMPAVTRRMVAPHRIETYIYRYALTLIGLDLVSTFGTQAGQFTLAYFLDASKIGIYSTAVTMVALLSTLQGALIAVFRPQVAELVALNKHELLAEMFHRVTRWSLALSFPVALSMIVLSPAFMQIFGKDFGAGAPVLALVTLGQLFNIATGPVGMMLLMTGHERTLGVASIGQFVTAVLLNILLVPVIGLTGAGAANMLGTVVYYSVLVWLVHRRLGMLPFDASWAGLILPFALTSLVGGGVYLAAQYLPLNPLWYLVLGSAAIALVFSAAMFAVGLDGEERLLLREGFERVRARVWGRTGN